MVTSSSDRRLDAAAKRLCARVYWAVLGKSALRVATWGLFACGTAALLARYALHFERVEAAWAFAPLAAVPFVAAAIARKKRLSRAGAVAWLDARSDAGGALLTRLEVDDERWTERVDRALGREIALPRARIARPLLQALPALAFAAVAMAIELPRAPDVAARKLEAASVERIEEALETLKEEVNLEPELARELDERLDRLKDDSGTPEEAFESIDGLEERLAQEGERLSDQIAAAQEALEDAHRSAAQDPEGAQAELEKTMQSLAKAGLEKNLSEALKAELASGSLELPPGTKLDARKIEGLSKELSEGMSDKLAKLGKAGLAKAGKLGKAGELAKLDGFEPTGHVCDESCKKPGGT